ncbi:hypothetical protein LBMAG42_27090 [Deltaproteobacteria bacterium]|nr:hypothetical protein LBMAG42_27090 [Deltaproteobacteria bacterium]
MTLTALALAVLVGPGVWRPLIPASPEEAEVSVRAFRMATTPVIVEEYQRFVKAHPEWQRGRVGGALADESYLASWASPVEAGPGIGTRAPATAVSWFAARAYCASEGGRLPTEAEWEFAASASETTADASRDPVFVAQLLKWYSAPTPAVLPEVGLGRANVWGVRDLHGLVWEWVDDFNASFVSADARQANGGQELKYCGGGAEASPGDKADYAAFMRSAMRSALSGRSTTRMLGFRCVWDVAS